MGVRWGRQISVAMTYRDEQAFVAFLNASADIRILVAAAPAREELFLEALPPPRSRWHLTAPERALPWKGAPSQFFFWNTAFPWTPDIRPTANGEGVYIHDISRAPLIEYSRRPMLPNTERSRLFWAKSVTPGGAYAFRGYPYPYDAESFNCWYEEVVSWIKSHSRAYGPRHYRQYFMPRAWSWGRPVRMLERISSFSERMRAQLQKLFSRA